MEPLAVFECELPLCVTCTEIFQSAALVDTLESRDRGEDCRHEVIVVKTEFIGETARQGCPICSRLYSTFSQEDQIFLKEELFDACKAGLEHLYNAATTYRFIFSNIYEKDHLRLEFQYDTGLTETDSRYLKASLLLLNEEGGLDTNGRFFITTILQTKNDNLLEINRRPTSNLLDSSTSSSSSWDLISEWMFECEFKHTSCRDGTSFIPTRLIDVGPMNLEFQITINVGPKKLQFGPNGGNVRLVTKENIPAESRYIALSHCWGGYTPTTLEMDNIQEMKDGISVDLLPKTFRNAVAITRKFGIRYLWIDCLCIIQGCLQDWQQESAMMWQVYSNCVINIAATGAQDARAGLFFDRNASITQPFKISIKQGGATGSENYSIVDHEMCSRGLESQPMCRRGWFCQERALSPRTIHFASKQLFWECRELSACELFPSGLPAVFRPDMTKSVAHLLFPEKSFSSSSTEYIVKYQLIPTWFSMVRLYTKASLTFERDKLVAIAGIASMMHDRVGSEYLAGLWKPYLQCQLLWISDYNALTKRYSSYVAPSWSWASVDGPTRLSSKHDPSQHLEYLVDVVNIQVQLSSKNPFGQVCGGFLQLRGHFAEARSVESYSKKQRDLSFLPLKVTRDTKSVASASRDFFAHRFRFVVDVGFYPSRILESEMKQLYLLPVAQKHDPEYPNCCGLILRKTENRTKRDEFCRWGYFETSSDEGINELRQLTRAFDATNAESSGLKYHDDKRGGLKYDVTIV